MCLCYGLACKYIYFLKQSTICAGKILISYLLLSNFEYCGLYVNFATVNEMSTE